jgi:hypothetical protein
MYKRAGGRSIRAIRYFKLINQQRFYRLFGQFNVNLSCTKQLIMRLSFRKVFFRAFLFISLLVTGFSSKGQSKEKVLHELNSLLINAVMDDLFPPPIASRIYTYPNIAFYECIRHADKTYSTLAGKLNGLTALTAPEKGTDHFIAACIAYSYTGQALIGSEYKFEDWRTAFLDSLKKNTDSILLNRSADYGKKTAQTIIAWMKKDKYGETRAMERFTYSQKEGHWQPTPVDFMPALEPNWRYMRPMTLRSASQFSPKEKLVFSKSKASLFYKNTKQVYEIVKNLDSTQKAIALYWDDNPNIGVERGHLHYFIHKISPAGHWVMITRQACLEKNVSLLKASQAYTLTTIALYDAFIACWDEKYRTDLVRPVSFIKKYIDEKWEPFIQTPPFPEFTSGHAVISNAAAVVLTKLFGDKYRFTDNTEIPFGIQPRTFSSFLEAANECCMSRVYGGIHYPETARISKIQGRQIGQYVLTQLLTR